MKKILLAEDNPANRELLREFLQRWGYEVIEALDGADALTKINATLPDLILCDIQLPVLDGFGVVQALRKDHRFTQIPVIALTAFAMQGDKEKILSAGFNTYQSKPIDSEMLRENIRRLLKRREQDS
jgi:CheY-like chemotaxis protein